MSHATIRPHDVFNAIKQNPWRIALPVILVTILALGYALVRPTTWEATQALVVRDEAGDRLALAEVRHTLHSWLAQVGDVDPEGPGVIAPREGSGGIGPKRDASRRPLHDGAGCGAA